MKLCTGSSIRLPPSRRFAAARKRQWHLTSSVGSLNVSSVRSLPMILPDCVPSESVSRSVVNHLRHEDLWRIRDTNSNLEEFHYG